MSALLYSQLQALHKLAGVTFTVAAAAVAVVITVAAVLPEVAVTATPLTATLPMEVAATLHTVPPVEAVVAAVTHGALAFARTGLQSEHAMRLDELLGPAVVTTLAQAEAQATQVITTAIPTDLQAATAPQDLTPRVVDPADTVFAAFTTAEVQDRAMEVQALYIAAA